MAKQQMTPKKQTPRTIRKNEIAGYDFGDKDDKSIIKFNRYPSEECLKATLSKYPQATIILPNGEEAAENAENK